MPNSLRSLLAALLTLGVVTAAAFHARKEPTLSKIEPLKKSGPRYWKGNLHTHSLWSDGDDFPEMIADWYERNGYQFLALTDHNVLSEGERWIDSTNRQVAMKKYLQRFGEPWVEQRTVKKKKQVRLKPLAEFRSLLEKPGRFLLVPGEEITHRYARYPVHMNAINLRNVIKPVDGDSVSETIQVNHRAVADQGKRLKRSMLTFLNHPNFQWGVRVEDMMAVPELKFFELQNGHPGVRNYGDKEHPSCERMWDIMLAQRLGKLRLPIVYGVATDDAHRYHQFGVGKVNPGRAWVMVQAPYLTAEAMVRAMHKGDFYCSTGVTLNRIHRAKKKLCVMIQSEKGVTYKTEFIVTLKNADFKAKDRPKKKEPPKPIKDEKKKKKDEDKKKEEPVLSKIYSDEIGRVAKTVKGNNAVYEFTGEELYVRAKVTSTKPHPNPYKAGDVEVAWTQPFRP